MLAVWLGALAILASTGAGLALAGPFVAPGGTTLRLRVLAASNSSQDQAQKRAVRDAVLPVVAPALAGVGSAAAARRAVDGRLPAIRVAAQRAAGAGTPVTVRLGRDAFPARRLGFLRFPAGTYDTLLVTLGAGRGHNWWTVLFPPFAFVDLGPKLAVVGPADPPPSADVHVVGPGGRQVAVIPAGSPGAEPVEVRFFLWDLWTRLTGGA